MSWRIGTKGVVARVTSGNRVAVFMATDCYLVDPASGHMLVSKIKPCMSKQKPINGKAANGSLQQPSFLGSLGLLG